MKEKNTPYTLFLIPFLGVYIVIIWALFAGYNLNRMNYKFVIYGGFYHVLVYVISVYILIATGVI